MFLFSLHIYPGVELLDHMVVLSFLRKRHTVFDCGCANLHSPVYQDSLFSTSLPTLTVVFLMIDILTGMRWYLIVVLICISLLISDAEHFSCACWPSTSSLTRMSIQVFCPLFNWVVFFKLSCMSCSYILDINPFSVISFANILFHSLGCLFCFAVDFLYCVRGFKLN